MPDSLISSTSANVLSRNSGCAPYPTFWRRSPLRKNPYISATPGMIEPEALIYKPEDGQFQQICTRDQCRQPRYKSNKTLGTKVWNSPAVISAALFLPPVHCSWRFPCSWLARISFVDKQLMSWGGKLCSTTVTTSLETSTDPSWTLNRSL